jgi:hypothetical protein
LHTAHCRDTRTTSSLRRSSCDRSERGVCDLFDIFSPFLPSNRIRLLWNSIGSKMGAQLSLERVKRRVMAAKSSLPAAGAGLTRDGASGKATVEFRRAGGLHSDGSSCAFTKRCGNPNLLRVGRQHAQRSSQPSLIEPPHRQADQLGRGADAGGERPQSAARVAKNPSIHHSK